MLTSVKERLLYLKNESGIEPVFKKVDKRIKSNMFITLIDYHVMQTVLFQLSNAGIVVNCKTLRNRMYNLITYRAILEDGRHLNIR